PAPFDAETTRRIQEAALGAFRAVGGRDYARVDVMVRANGEPVMLEVNTLPGMTETSLMPKAAAAAGLSYEELCQRMIDLAMNRSDTKHVGEKMTNDEIRMTKESSNVQMTNSFGLVIHSLGIFSSLWFSH